MTGPRSMDDEGEPRNYQTMHSGAEALDLSTGNGRRVGNRLSKHDRHGNQVHELGGQLANQQSPVSEVRADNSQVPVSATISGLCSEGPDAMTDNRDLPTGQRDSPIGQRDSSVGQRDDSWDQARQSCWDVVQSNVPTSTNIRAARNNFILSPQNDGSQQSDMIVTSPSLASSIPFSPVPSTAAVINAGASSALQSSSPFSDMDLLSNGAEGLAQPAGQMTNPSANMFPSPDPRFTLSSMMNSSVLSPSLVSLSYPGSLYDPSAGQSALSSSPLLGFPSYSTTRKRRIDQREKKDQEPSTSKTTASSSSATLTSAEASSDGEDPDAKKAKAVPEEKKDEAYWERRRKNNEAAKRSRDARRQKEEEIAMRATFLEQENLKLRAQVAILKNETAKLHYLLYNRRQ